ncbi:hypothetical protein CBM2587_B60312 [Cupriavidus taiwanensis]|uniref:Uncharacterized protein n=1 Tax=Cupriavidus taiwanensis TaxID=164546 RepID=A0A976A627_9BURK|nr:hypothetical protein CBM2587_B60312 [Cupriavidus taiwanensis]
MSTMLSGEIVSVRMGQLLKLIELCIPLTLAAG